VRRVLVTGADGFVGRHLVAALRSAGTDVVEHSSDNGDIADCRLAYQGVDHLFHLAARSYVPESWEDPRSFYETNVVGTVNALEFCRRQKASITLISSYVYGRPQRLPVDENHPLQPFNPYGHSKIMAEEAGRYFEAAFGVRLGVVRPFNLFGPGQREQFLIPTLLRQALSKGSPAIEVMDLRPRRDFLYIADFVDLLTRLASRERTGIYNAGAGVSVSIGELAGLINGLLDKTKPLFCLERPRPDEVLDMYADIGKARRELGWEPRTNLREGLRLSMEAMKSRP